MPYVKLCIAIAKSETLLSIVFTHCKINSDEARALALALDSHSERSKSRLKTLRLIGNGLGDVGTVAFSSALWMCETLTTVRLSLNQIGDEGACCHCCGPDLQ
jgi:hypothetical protein